jgi:hypothetical protein
MRFACGRQNSYGQPELDEVTEGDGAVADVDLEAVAILLELVGPVGVLGRPGGDRRLTRMDEGTGLLQPM